MHLQHIRRLQCTFRPVTAYTLKYPAGIRSMIENYTEAMPIMVNQKTMKCLNPHVLEAYKKYSTLEELPVIFVSVPADDEILLSIAINGGLDGFNIPIPQDVHTLIDKLYTATNEQIEAIAPLDYVADITAYYADIHDTPAPTTPQEPQPVNNDFDIPSLDINRQLMTAPARWDVWGSRSRSDTDFNGILFYTDESRFKALEGNPGQLTATGATAAVEFNYSTEPHQPRAMVIYNIWKKRTISAALQEAGIHIAVDMNVNREFFELNLLGVPAGWKSYANRAYSADIDHLHDAYNRACLHAQTDDITYFVYGRQTARELCESQNWIWINSDIGYGVIDGQTN